MLREGDAGGSRSRLASGVVVLVSCLAPSSPLARGGGYTNAKAYDHSSTLKSMQEIFGVSPLLRGAAAAGVNDLGDLFTSFP